MHDLFYVYDCTVCGEVLSDEVDTGDIYEPDQDEYFENIFCEKCQGKGHVSPRMQDGLHVMKQVDEERALNFIMKNTFDDE